MATLTVTFTAGADGGSPITAATLTLADATDPAKTADFEVSVTEYTAGSATVDQVDIEGTPIGVLADGQVLSMVMSATNASGTSAESVAVDAAPFSEGGTPGAPEAPTVTTGTWA